MPPNSITKLENADVSVANVNGEFYAITRIRVHALACKIDWRKHHLWMARSIF